MASEEAAGRRRRRLLVAGIISLVLTLVTIVLAITDPGWLGWARVVVWLCVSGTFLLAYRGSRTPS